MAYKISDEDRFKALLALYQEANSEITRYRDYEWKLPIWVAGLLVAVASAASQIDQLNFDCGILYILKTILAGFSIASTCFACWYVYFLHKKLTENRTIRRVISNAWEYTTKGAYVEQSLLPEKFEKEMPKFIDGIPHVIASWLFIVLVLVYNLLFTFAK